MISCEEILRRLKAACRSYSDKAWRQDDAYGTRKFIRRGLLKAEEAIESVPPEEDPRAWLDAVRAAVETAREELRRDPDDEDAWGPGATTTILGEIAKERAALPP